MSLVTVERNDQIPTNSWGTKTLDCPSTKRCSASERVEFSGALSAYANSYFRHRLLYDNLPIQTTVEQLRKPPTIPAS